MVQKRDPLAQFVRQKPGKPQPAKPLAASAVAPPKRRGRPRAYEPELALARALDVFWKDGFAATSLDDLSAATGMNRPSLYGAFGAMPPAGGCGFAAGGFEAACFGVPGFELPGRAGGGFLFCTILQIILDAYLYEAVHKSSSAGDR